MEAVHRAGNRSWIDHTATNLKQFRDNWSDAISFNLYCPEENETFLKNMVSEEEYADIEKQCGLESMRCEYQERVELSSTINLPDITLETLKFQAEELDKRKTTPKYATTFHNSQKYLNYPPHKMLGPMLEIDSIPNEPINSPEILLSVQVYVPERRTETKSSINFVKIPLFQVDQELLILGSQYLTELRDRIECVSDKAVVGDFSDCPTVEPTSTCKDLYKSGFFYINGTFYNDMRDKDCRDYSDVIIKWSEKENRGIGPFKKAVMEKTRFIDLNIQLGYPYVYTHQGECEHLVVFSDLKMHTTHDECNRNAYPLFVYMKTSKRIFCMVCHAYTSSWVVYDNRRLPENPFFFCKHCFFSFNYDQYNQKIGNFRAYHFPDRSKLT